MVELQATETSPQFSTPSGPQPGVSSLHLQQPGVSSLQLQRVERFSHKAALRESWINIFRAQIFQLSGSVDHTSDVNIVPPSVEVRSKSYPSPI